MVGHLISRLFQLLPDIVKAVVVLASMYFARVIKHSTQFSFGGKDFPYFYHPYRASFRTERTVEVPIFMDILRSAEGKSVLEVGNVLSHYCQVDHDIVDKYEKSPSVINEDIVDYRPGKVYDLIICISTLEHIGWDERPRQHEKIIDAVANIENLLAPGGEFVASVPRGGNTGLDGYIDGGVLTFDEIRALRSTGYTNEWMETTYEKVRTARYGRRTMKASAVLIVRIRK